MESDIEKIYGRHIERARVSEPILKNLEKDFYPLKFLNNVKLVILHDSPSIRRLIQKASHHRYTLPDPHLRERILARLFNGKLDMSRFALYQFKGERLYENENNKLSNGALCTIADMYTIHTSIMIEPLEPFVVSAKLEINMFGSVDRDGLVYLKCEVLRRGNNFMFLGFEIFDQDFKMIAKGTHVVAILNEIAELDTARGSGRRRGLEMKPKL